MKKSDPILLIALMMILALLSCAGDKAAVYESAAEPAAATKSVVTAGSRGDVISEDRSPAIWTERKLVRTGSMDIEVESVESALSEITAIAENRSGIVAGSRISRNGEGRLQGTLSVRVPTEEFDRVIAELKVIGEVERLSVETEDITKAYYDLETRLDAKKRTEKRLRDILENRTGKLSDVLAVERELDRVVMQIEQMKGEKRYYDQQVAVSTITISLREARKLVRPGFFGRIRDAFRDSLSVLSASLSMLVYLAAFLIPWLIIAAVVWFIVKAIRGRRRERKTERAE